MNNKQLERDVKMCEWVNSKFKQAYVAKAPLMEKWKKYESAYDGDFFKDASRPDYKSNQVTNHVFSTIESIRPIMTDNNPKFLASPTTPEGADHATDIQTALNYEWRREGMDTKLPAQLLPMLIYGTCVWFLPYDAKTGEVSCKAVNPFNIFPDPLAEDMDSAEYIIYATYKHANQLKKMFPDKAEQFVGGNISHSELVADRDKDAVGAQEQILTLEMWFRDWTSMEELEDEEGNKTKKLKYPNGRVITCCPDAGVILSDKKNPYKDGKFPFIFMKDYEKPFEFWGRGEVEQILSPQVYMNELTNQIIDNAKNTANMQWIIDKNSGIPKGKLTNRPGAVIRKTPGSEVRRDTPPAMPTYVRDTIEVMKKDIQDVSGVFDSLKGEKQTGVVAAQAIMALQEASQARVRLKIKLMEHQLANLANMWYSRMQQYWKIDKWVKVTDIEGRVDFSQITPEMLKQNYDIEITAGSTMPTNKNAMLDLMIRLAQTTAEDGMPMVDRNSILEFIPNVDRKQILQRFEDKKNEQQQKEQEGQQQQAQMQQAQQLGEQQVQTIQGTLQDITSMVDMVNKQVDELMKDKVQREEKEYMEEIENKGYEKGKKEGLKEGENNGKMQTEENSEKGNEEETMLNNEDEMVNGVEPTENYMSDEEINAMISPEALDANPEVNTGEIPAEVLEELANMSPEELMQLLEEYPELMQMLQGDMQNMGGMMNGQGQSLQG